MIFLLTVDTFSAREPVTMNDTMLTDALEISRCQPYETSAKQEEPIINQLDVRTLTKQIKEEILRDIRKELGKSLTPTWVKTEVDWSDDEVTIRPCRKSQGHQFTVLSHTPGRRHTVCNDAPETQEPLYENPDVTKQSENSKWKSMSERRNRARDFKPKETVLYENTLRKGSNSSLNPIQHYNVKSSECSEAAHQSDPLDNLLTQVIPYHLTKRLKQDEIYENNVAAEIAKLLNHPNLIY